MARCGCGTSRPAGNCGGWRGAGARGLGLERGMQAGWADAGRWWRWRRGAAVERWDRPGITAAGAWGMGPERGVQPGRAVAGLRQRRGLSATVGGVERGIDCDAT